MIILGLEFTKHFEEMPVGPFVLMLNRTLQPVHVYWFSVKRRLDEKSYALFARFSVLI